MRAPILVFLTSISAAAHATPCADDNRRPEAMVDRGSFVACWSPTGKCVTVDGQQVAHPAVTASTTAIRDRSRARMDACLGDHCKPVGTRLRAAIRRATPAFDTIGDQRLEALTRNHVTVTSDLSLAVIADGERIAVWNIPRDRSVVLSQDVVEVRVIGNALFARWNSTTMHAVETLLDGNGNPLGHAFSSIAATVLDDTHVATLAADGILSIRDTRTGRETDTLAVAPAMSFASLASLPSNRLGVTWSQTSGAMSVAVVDLLPRLVLGRVQAFDACPL